MKAWWNCARSGDGVSEAHWTRARAEGHLQLLRRALKPALVDALQQPVQRPHVHVALVLVARQPLAQLLPLVVVQRHAIRADHLVGHLGRRLERHALAPRVARLAHVGNQIVKALGKPVRELKVLFVLGLLVLVGAFEALGLGIYVHRLGHDASYPKKRS